jgi:hypothetical protein
LPVGKFVSVLTGLDATDCCVSGTIKKRVNNSVKNNYEWIVTIVKFCKSFIVLYFLYVAIFILNTLAKQHNNNIT